MKQQPERQRGLDREIRVTSLRASAATSTRNPTANRILAEPDCDVSAIPEPLLVLRPVLDRILGLVLRGYETGRTCCHWISFCESSVDRQVSTAISSASSRIHAPTPRSAPTDHSGNSVPPVPYTGIYGTIEAVRGPRRSGPSRLPRKPSVSRARPIRRSRARASARSPAVGALRTPAPSTLRRHHRPASAPAMATPQDLREWAPAR